MALDDADRVTLVRGLSRDAVPDPAGSPAGRRTVIAHGSGRLR